MRIAYAIATWSGARLVETIHSVPPGVKLEIVSTRQHGWPLSKAWNYAAEQLIAELGAAFLCAEFGFDGDVRNAGYIANWIELLKSDKRAFFTACSQAAKAAEYLRGLALAEAADIAA